MVKHKTPGLRGSLRAIVHPEWQTVEAVKGISRYPMGLFQGAIRLILYTLIPAGFVGAVPVEVVETHSLSLLGGMAAAAAISVLVLNVVFYVGLRRYESGSALNVNL